MFERSRFWDNPLNCVIWEAVKRVLLWLLFFVAAFVSIYLTFCAASHDANFREPVVIEEEVK